MDHSVKMLPIYSALLLFISYLHIAYFYGHFGIDILNYIDLTELFILSLPVLETLSYAIFVAIAPLVIVAFIAFLGFITKSKTKDLQEVIDAERNKKHTSKSITLTDQELVEKMKREMGFHLVDRITELKKLFISGSDKRELMREITILILYVCIVSLYINP